MFYRQFNSLGLTKGSQSKALEKAETYKTLAICHFALTELITWSHSP